MNFKKMSLTLRSALIVHGNVLGNNVMNDMEQKKIFELSEGYFWKEVEVIATGWLTQSVHFTTLIRQDQLPGLVGQGHLSPTSISFLEIALERTNQLQSNPSANQSN